MLPYAPDAPPHPAVIMQKWATTHTVIMQNAAAPTRFCMITQRLVA